MKESIIETKFTYQEFTCSMKMDKTELFNAKCEINVPRELIMTMVKKQITSNDWLLKCEESQRTSILDYAIAIELFSIAGYENYSIDNLKFENCTYIFETDLRLKKLSSFEDIFGSLVRCEIQEPQFNDSFSSQMLRKIKFTIFDLDTLVQTLEKHTNKVLSYDSKQSTMSLLEIVMTYFNLDGYKYLLDFRRDDLDFTIVACNSIGLEFYGSVFNLLDK